MQTSLLVTEHYTAIQHVVSNETLETLKNVPKMRRQTHMCCTICKDVAETYNQKKCYKCGSIYKWSIPWKNLVET